MRCAVGCSEKISPAVGFANLRGAAGTATAGTEGVYPLCFHHIQQIKSGDWDKVILLGWEELPDTVIESEEVRSEVRSDPVVAESVAGGAEEGDRESDPGVSGDKAEEPDPEII